MTEIEIKEYRKIRKWDWKSTAQATSAVLMVFVATLSFLTARSAIETQQTIARTTRRAAIRPALRLTAETGFNKDRSKIIFSVQNVGPGNAHMLRAITQRDSVFVGVVQNYFSLVQPTEWRHRPGTVIRDSVLDREGAELQEDALPAGWYAYYRIPCNQLFPGVNWNSLNVRQREDYLLPMVLTVYFSYLDEDFSEEWTLMKFPPSAPTGPMMIGFGSEGFADSMTSLSHGLSNFSTRQLSGVGLRDSAGWFRKLPVSLEK